MSTVPDFTLPDPPDPGTAGPTSDALADCVEVFRRWLHLPDPGHVYVTLATVVANLDDGDPLWVLVVGPPSSGKTEALGAVAGLPYVHPAATITEAALLSGTPKKEQSNGARGGLLRSIGDFGIILCKDFTSVLAQNKDTRSAVLAAMREVYDGSWTRHVGTDGGRTLHWSGKVGLLAGCTPTLDRHHAVMAALGERFLLYRLPEVDPTEVSARALDHVGREHQMRTELATAAVAVIGAATEAGSALRALTDQERSKLQALATFAVRARSGVERDGYSREVLLLPEPEGPARFVLALRRLLGGLEAIGCTTTETWSVLDKIAVDCMPATRSLLARELLTRNAPVRTADLATAVDFPTRTASTYLEDLALLGLAQRGKGGGAANSPDLWEASDWLRRYWPEARKKAGRD